MRKNQLNRIAEDRSEGGTSGFEDADETDVELIHGVQRYFECLKRRETPDPELVAEWDRFEKHYLPMIRKRVLARGVTAADADDCVQEVFLAVFQRLASFQIDPERRGFRRWLHSVVLHKPADVVRRRTRHPVGSLPANDDATSVADATADPIAAFVRKEGLEFVHRMFRELQKQVSDTDSRVFYMRAIAQMSPERVAQALDLNRKEVRDAYYRATLSFNALIMIHAACDFATHAS